MPRTALYTGTFDPVTNGHLDVVRHACRLVDRLVIAIGVHAAKAPIFTPDGGVAPPTPPGPRSPPPTRPPGGGGRRAGRRRWARERPLRSRPSTISACRR